MLCLVSYYLLNRNSVYRFKLNVDPMTSEVCCSHFCNKVSFYHKLKLMWISAGHDILQSYITSKTQYYWWMLQADVGQWQTNKNSSHYGNVKSLWHRCNLKPHGLHDCLQHCFESQTSSTSAAVLLPHCHSNHTGRFWLALSGCYSSCMQIWVICGRCNGCAAGSGSTHISTGLELLSH